MTNTKKGGPTEALAAETHTNRFISNSFMYATPFLNENYFQLKYKPLESLCQRKRL